MKMSLLTWIGMIEYTMLPIGRVFKSSKLASNFEIKLFIAVCIVVFAREPLLNMLILSMVNVLTKQFVLLT